MFNPSLYKEHKPFKLHFQLSGVFENHVYDYIANEHHYSYEYREINWQHYQQSVPIIVRDENNLDEVKSYIESVLHNSK